MIIETVAVFVTTVIFRQCSVFMAQTVTSSRGKTLTKFCIMMKPTKSSEQVVQTCALLIQDGGRRPFLKLKNCYIFAAVEPIDTKFGFSFSFTLKQPKSKFYPQIKSPGSSFYIYERPLTEINVMASFCALNLHTKF